MTNRDFRLLTARITLTAPMVAKLTTPAKPVRPRVSVQRSAAAKQAR